MANKKSIDLPKRARSAEASIRYKRPPKTPEELWSRVRALTGVELARTPVCRGHDAPADYFAKLFFERPPLALIHGPRGGGKSFLSALETHLRSRWRPNHGTLILGGSRAQSSQVFLALRELVRQGRDEGVIEKLLKDGATYSNGSEVAILAASPTSVRGPHVPSLKLDEVDEIAPEIREAAMGMCMNRQGESASVVMTSTWHRNDGPMTQLLEKAQAGAFPFFRFCAFEILERCPDSRSGPNLEKCPECPLFAWCHEDRDDDPSGLPKAKRSQGHYAIEALIQKVLATSARTFEADYLCKGPKAEGLWFTGFNESSSVSEQAEYDPALPVHLAVDPGVFTGALLFQVALVAGPAGPLEEIHVFADYLATGLPAEQNARAILELARTHCNGRIDAAWCDPSGGARTSIGPTVLGEYERAGLRELQPWPRGSVADGLALVDSFVQPADGRSRLLLHPRCVSLTRALRNYRRARRGGQWQDYPEDPQHPHEDLIDALRGGLRALFPEGRRTKASLPRVSARRIF